MYDHTHMMENLSYTFDSVFRPLKLTLIFAGLFFRIFRGSLAVSSINCCISWHVDFKHKTAIYLFITSR